MKEYDPQKNYCGPSWLLTVFKILLPSQLNQAINQRLRHLPGGIDINEICFMHDVDYLNFARRKHADKLFLSRMIRAISDEIHKDWNEEISPFQIFLAMITSYLFYCAVRCFGWMSHFKGLPRLKNFIHSKIQGLLKKIKGGES